MIMAIGMALIIATGGLAGLIAPHCRTVQETDPFLTLKGLVRYPEARTLSLLANYRTEDPVARRKRLKERKRALRRLENRRG